MQFLVTTSTTIIYQLFASVVRVSLIYKSSTVSTSKSHSMEVTRESVLSQILRNVHTIHHLTPEVINNLKETDIGRLAIPEIRTDVIEFGIWYRANQPSGVEFDARYKRIVVKARKNPVRERVHSILKEWLGKVTSDLRNPTMPEIGLFEHNGGTKVLKGPYSDYVQEPDLAIIPEGRDKFPLLVVEIGDLDGKKDPVREAQRWLHGSNGEVQMVIHVEFKQVPHADNPPPTEAPAEIGGGKSWGIPDKDLRALRDPWAVYRVGKNIMKWHSHHNSPLLGVISAEITLVSKMGTQKFSLGEFSEHLTGPYGYMLAKLPEPIIGFPISKTDLLRGQYQEGHFYYPDVVRKIRQGYAKEKDGLEQKDGLFYLPIQELKQGIYKGTRAYQKERAEYKARNRLMELMGEETLRTFIG